jgi:hypothetical protein
MSATPSVASSSGSGPSRQKKTATHHAGHSIRAQAASSSSLVAGQDKGKGRDGGLVGNSKIVYKALLESPLNVKWCVCPARRLLEKQGRTDMLMPAHTPRVVPGPRCRCTSS